MSAKDKINPPRESGLSFGFNFNQRIPSVKGRVTISLKEDGVERILLEKDNIYTLDGGVLAAMQFSNGSRPLTHLAVGTGASGASSSPDIPDARQRRLNVELVRKEFSSVVYRDSNGNVSAVPTNVIDFTAVYQASDAVGPLNEMGLISARDGQLRPVLDVFPARDTTVDLNDFDVLVNYLTFPVINKPNGSVLAITWRLTF